MVVAAVAVRRMGGSFPVWDVAHRHEDGFDFPGKCRRGDAFAVEVVMGERFLHFLPPFCVDVLPSGNVEKPRRARLFELERIVPETLLPALPVDDGKLDRLGEPRERRLQREQLDQFLGIGRAVGFNDDNPVRRVLEFVECAEQLFPRSAADATAADRDDRVGEFAEQLRIDAGVLVVVDNHVRVDAARAQSGQELAEIGRFARAEKTDEENQWCHRRSLHPPAGPACQIPLSR